MKIFFEEINIFLNHLLIWIAGSTWWSLRSSVHSATISDLVKAQSQIDSYPIRFSDSKFSFSRFFMKSIPFVLTSDWRCCRISLQDRHLVVSDFVVFIKDKSGLVFIDSPNFGMRRRRWSYDFFGIRSDSSLEKSLEATPESDFWGLALVGTPKFATTCFGLSVGFGDPGGVDSSEFRDSSGRFFPLP